MVRFFMVIILNIGNVLYLLPKMMIYINNTDRYSEEKCYKLAQDVIRCVAKRGRIRTKVTGQELLPEQGGYIMYANHQGRYDALGIMGAHEKPCRVVMAMHRSRKLITSQFIDLTKSKRLDIDNIRQQAVVLKEIISEVKNGSRYLIFPEGSYEKNHNNLQKFKPGSFKCAEKARCPIVPVAIYDSYKPFELTSIKKVETQVHFLEPISFDEYKELGTNEIAGLVAARIAEKIAQIDSEEQVIVQGIAS